MRQFMADASHELRTPLTSIRGYAELARMQRAYDDKNGGPTSSASDAEALERIEGEGTRMSRLVEDLLTLARGDIGAPIESLPVDVTEVIESAIEGAEAAYPNRRFGITVTPGTTVRGDHDQLLRVVRNLVTNAAVHTAPGRPIRVAATREVGEVVIRVIDSGPGLPPSRRPTCSSGSGGRTGRGPDRAVAAGSDWRSWRPSSRPTAAPSASSARSRRGSTVTVRLPAR